MTNDHKAILELTNSVLNGTAAKSDLATLSKLLRENPGLQDVYLSFLDTHAALAWMFRGAESQNTSHGVSSSGGSWVSRGNFVAAIPWFVGVLSLMVAVLAVMRPQIFGGRPLDVVQAVPVVSAAESEQVLAVLVNQAGAKFKDSNSPDGVKIGASDYELQSGVVHVRFLNGTDMVVAAPAKFSVVNDMNVRLDAGNIRAISPPQAKGFTVSTIDARYVDLGTEFGLRIDPETKSSDLLVFDGQVNVEEHQSGRVLSEVFEGGTSRLLGGVEQDAPTLSPEDFPSPSSIGFARWNEHRPAMMKSPGLIALFPFQEGENRKVLQNLVPNGAPNGIIHGARWASGRWLGKDALLFDRDADYVQLEIPGEHEEFTIATWLNLDRLDYQYSVIMNSDHADRGDVHFQFTRQGFPRGGVFVEGGFSDQWIGPRVELKEWTHLASVISMRTKKQSIYINGTQVRSVQYHGSETITPGSCRLGNWLPTGQDAWASRPLRGRIDELAIWNRALSHDEVQQLVEAGRPSLIWKGDGSD
ncbi:LamG-like jellyroll fold domain-containing protein [Calycomorphotria hydatis]|uniref:FecR protein n=1 Tax=Calycomorphotria hydatis TaxID=2528027 RepID=A0A517T988_9PLAN|nr:LamG-like jellyroll fold domain-containing protein [Calycomorphotria hydatis]QDT64936.1 FecR protein [Calycomorphotria hydatis]